MFVRVAIILILLISAGRIMAQDSLTVYSEDTIVTTGGPDTVIVKSYASRYDPRKALLYAAVIPGLGQIYNKKYWKLPLVYGGFFAIGYAVNFYHTNYQFYKGELFYNLNNGLANDGDENPNLHVSTATLRTVVDKTRRERDFWMIMMGAMYLLQIVDAHVDAHLKEFDINPNLRVSIEPAVTHDELLGRQKSFGVLIKF